MEDGSAAGRDKLFPIVGIGASAGGLEALRLTLGRAGDDPGMAFVIVQHLDPNHESMMAQLIERYTALPVRQIVGGERVEPNQVYVIPPGRGLNIAQGRLALSEFSEPRGMRRPIDDFFEALAADQGALSACVILSGTGGDGSRGLRAIKEHGGICVVQQPETARYDGMPLAAVGTGLVDFVEEPERIVHCLGRYFGQRSAMAGAGPDQPPIIEDHLGELCRTVRKVTGHDFSGYKRSTLLRRTERRMRVLGLAASDDYLRRVRSDSAEASALFRDLLINVTRFFRDPEPFELLRERVIEPLVRDREPGDEIRVWVPGCSSGEEAFSLAMLLADAAERHGGDRLIQIFASDIDEQMLGIARSATYPTAALADIPDDLRTRFTNGHGDSFTIDQAVRDLVRFSAHNVIQDPPFSRIDLISCRNLLIYFDDGLQQAVLPMFHYALNPDGCLFLGPSETIGRFDDLFDPIDQRSRLFRRRGARTPYPLELPGAGARRVRAAEPHRDPRARGVPELEAEALRKLTRSYVPASLLVDDEGRMLASWGPVGRYFDFPRDGVRRQSAPGLAKRGLRGVLASLIRQSRGDGARHIVRDVAVSTDFGTQHVAVICDPVADGTLLVVIRETGPFEPSPADGFVELVEADDQVTLLEDELRITRHRLRSAVEELETANEELKSSNEEMMSMNEELQSTNEELTTVNDELNSKLDQLTVANADLKNFFDSTQFAVIVVDRELAVRSFTAAATRIFPLKDSDCGRALADVTPLLEDRRYLEQARAAAGGGEEFESRIRSADGERDFVLRVIPYRRLDGTVDGATLILAEITAALGLERELDEQRERLEQAVRVAGVGIWEFDAQGGHFTMDPAERRLFGLDENATLSESTVLARIHPEDRERVREAQQAALEGRGIYDETFRVVGRDGEVRWLHSVGRAHQSRARPRLLGVSFDCTAERESMATRELLLREMNHRVKNLFAVVSGLIAVCAREAADVREFAADLGARIAAMGRAHSLTQQASVERPLELAELIETVIAPTRNGQDVTIEGPPLTIPLRLVTPLALIFHEWATNAAKYGALSHSGGGLSVRWKLEDGVTRIDWSESGTGAGGNDEGRAGFGTRLIQATVNQLRARLSGDQGDGFLYRQLELDGLTDGIGP